MKFNIYSLALVVFASAALSGCKNDDPNEQHYQNKLYVSSPFVVDDLLIKNDEPSASRAITTRLAKATTEQVTVTFEANEAMTAEYNLIYADNASALPAEYYEIPENVSTIKAGDISGNDVVVNFTNTHKLNMDLRYVLPVTIVQTSNIESLASARTVYFLFKGAALINVVANIRKIYFPVTWAAGVDVNSLQTITVEALVRSSDWEDSRDNALSSLFGIEGKFLIRIGDSDRPRNQLQLVAPGGNWPGPNVAPGLPINEWIHVAIVYDKATGERIYYQNGVVVASDKGASGNVSLTTGCYIGFAYSADRYLPGDISELRIWNIQRTADQIASNPYYVDPTTAGLLAYWKFNEGTGSAIMDATGKGTNLTPVNGTPTWVPVELPKIGK